MRLILQRLPEQLGIRAVPAFWSGSLLPTSAPEQALTTRLKPSILELAARRITRLPCFNGTPYQGIYDIALSTFAQVHKHPAASEDRRRVAVQGRPALVQ